ncbi:MAG: 3-hydroxyacyl-CoA dehydrogenase NAD-binding domain-containing protein [Ferruginibacter sp.]
MIQSIGVAGAGTMGSGIALAAATKHFNVILFDTDAAVIAKARAAIQKNLDFLIGRNKIDQSAGEIIFKKIQFTTHLPDCKADIIIEAIVENIAAKKDLFQQLLQHNDADCIFASNTSSLSITEIQTGLMNAGNVVGMHFFNPAQVMKLVEVVQGEHTDEAVAQTILELCHLLGKTPVLCKDKPGFIVNRVARQYYLEAMKLVESGHAEMEDVDTIMESLGFKMGPFKLMDLIGIDINLAVSTSLYNAMENPVRLQPSSLQVEKVSKGNLGKKTGKGFYTYDSPL